LDLKEIKELIALMRRNELTELEIETEELRVKLKKGTEPVVSHAYYPPPTGQAAPSLPAAGAPAASSAEPEKFAGVEISSPMPGTFYLSPSPEAAPFVQVGQKVTEDTVVCILEAMKVMNEIKAETSGTITEILVENGKPVGYGTVLFRIK
jgi:acetyl-CoA carboxylase biotin carboxyl carrier protein